MAICFHRRKKNQDFFFERELFMTVLFPQPYLFVVHGNVLQKPATNGHF